jgi:endonuclease/exonuclease/phosphatase family metal-dependent hydrolase
MSLPARVTVTTFNVWGLNHWSARANRLIQTLLTLRSDVYLFQEVNPQIIQCFDENLYNYSRVVADGNESWIRESNIYWNKDIFNLLDFGFSDLEMPDYPLRGLFWVRLCLKSDPSKVCFFSTAHFPWVGCERETETGVNQRIVAALKVCEHLRRLVALNEAAIFAGDLNEDYHPVRILSEECAFIDIFEGLDLPPPITHPVRPSDPEEELKPNRTLDWILCSLPSNCRPVAAFAKAIRGGSFPPVSDHLPVVGVIEMA